MKVKKLIRYVEIIDRQLELLYQHFQQIFQNEKHISQFWGKLSEEKGTLYSCLNLVEQVGKQNQPVSEFTEDELLDVIGRLNSLIHQSIHKTMRLEDCLEIAVTLETEHYVKFFNILNQLVDKDFKSVIQEMNLTKKILKELKSFITEVYPDNENKSKLISKIQSHQS